MTHPVALHLPDAGCAVLRGCGQPVSRMAPAAPHAVICHAHIQRYHEPEPCAREPHLRQGADSPLVGLT